MNFIDAIRKRMLRFLRIEPLSENPYSSRLTFVGDKENIIKYNIEAYKIWYLGDGNDLLSFYTAKELYGNNEEPRYNRNERKYFWAISVHEANIKRVHSGIPNAIVTTLTNVIGSPEIKCKDGNVQEIINYVCEKNNLKTLLNQQQIPLTMAEGWGAFKVNIDTSLCDYPIIQFYEAGDCRFVYKSGVLIGIAFFDYYTYKNKKYVLVDTRRVENGNSKVEYSLYRIDNEQVEEVSFSEVPELSEFAGKQFEIQGYNHVLGVPCKFFFDPNNKDYGRSIFAGKLDLFDDLDQDLSQNSQTVRVSTPVEYYPADLLKRDGSGKPLLPSAYNRQYVAKTSVPDGDGKTNSEIQTTQPVLNFQQYSDNAMTILGHILTGILSPATLGIDIARKDNAEAQREKEKVTIMTRNNIIESESKILKELMNICIAIKQYIDTNVISKGDYDIGVKFDEFANPSFENEIQVLGDAWSGGQISTRKYVDLLWGDKLSEQEKEEEISWLDDNKQRDTLTFNEFDNNNENDNGNKERTGTNTPKEEGADNQTAED